MIANYYTDSGRWYLGGVIVVQCPHLTDSCWYQSCHKGLPWLTWEHPKRVPQTSTKLTASCLGILAKDRVCWYALSRHRCCHQADPFSSLAARTPDKIAAITWFCCQVATPFRIRWQAIVLPVEDNVNITNVDQRLNKICDVYIASWQPSLNVLNNCMFDFSRTSGFIT